MQEKTKSSEAFVGTICYLPSTFQNKTEYLKIVIIGVCSSKTLLEVDLFLHNFPELDEHDVCYKYVNILIITKIIG